MDSQVRLTIQAAGSIDSLVNRLLRVGDAVSVQDTALHWDAGIGNLSQTINEVGIVLGGPWVPMALSEVEEWLRTEAETDEVIVSIFPVFSRRVGRND